MPAAPSYSAVSTTQGPAQSQGHGQPEKYEGEPPAYSSEPTTPAGSTEPSGQPTFDKQ